MNEYLMTIFALLQRVPVSFNTGVSGLGRQLDPSTSDEDVRLTYSFSSFCET